MIFFIWLHGKELLLEYFNYINNHYNEIRYIWEWWKSRLQVLDVMVKLEGNKVLTDLFSKPTDTRLYLDNGSCHPRHVKQAIPYGQALRVRRICDSEKVCDARLKEL